MRKYPSFRSSLVMKSPGRSCRAMAEIVTIFIESVDAFNGSFKIEPSIRGRSVPSGFGFPHNCRGGPLGAWVAGVSMPFSISIRATFLVFADVFFEEGVSSGVKVGFKVIPPLSINSWDVLFSAPNLLQFWMKCFSLPPMGRCSLHPIMQFLSSIW